MSTAGGGDDGPAADAANDAPEAGEATAEAAGAVDGGDGDGDGGDSNAWIRFAVTFGVLALGFEIVYSAWALDSHAFHVFLTYLADATGLALEPFYEPVRVSDTRVSIPGFVVDVDYGCDAVQVCTLLMSAVLAFPARWNRKLLGILIGVPWMQAWNVTRIATLVVIGRIWGHNVFETTHVYIWPSVLIVISLASWMFWVRWATAER